MLRALVVGLVVSLAFALFRRFAPWDSSSDPMVDNGRRLPYGVAGVSMWVLGALIGVGGFCLLKSVNWFWASLDRDAILTVYPVAFIWGFLPGFAAIALPWPLTLWLLRRFGYSGQAAEIVAAANRKGGYDSERVMRWAAWVTLLPIALFTLPAIPMHLSAGAREVRVTPYGHLSPEVFRLADAKKAWRTDGYYLQDGKFASHPDLLIDFADGRRLDANAVGDSGGRPLDQLIHLLLDDSNLTPVHVQTAQEIPQGR